MRRARAALLQNCVEILRMPRLRPMSEVDQSRNIGRGPAVSGLSRSTDILRKKIRSAMGSGRCSRWRRRKRPQGHNYHLDRWWSARLVPLHRGFDRLSERTTLHPSAETMRLSAQPGSARVCRLARSSKSAAICPEPEVRFSSGCRLQPRPVRRSCYGYQLKALPCRKGRVQKQSSNNRPASKRVHRQLGRPRKATL